MKIIVLGAGMVGKAIAIDLSKNFNVTSADNNKESLKLLHQNYLIKTKQFDISNKRLLGEALKEFDLAVCAVPGFMGFETLKTIIEAKKNVVDISFFPENALELNTLAKRNGITAIVDCGVAPGMDNIILGYYDTKMKVDFFECLVGGLPKVHKFPYEYKAPFSPIDVIEEYTRPARYVEDGCIVTKPALTDIETVEFKEAGMLESFNTDGLRTLLYTMRHIPDMKEKTLRHPGHIEFIKALKGSGFFDKEKINVGNTEISPLEFSSKVLISQWKFEHGEEEFTVMRVTIRGKDKDQRKEIIYTLYDEYDQVTEMSSMARTTGYTCTAAVNLLSEGLFKKKGVFPPELIGRHPGCFKFFLDYLKERNVVYCKKEKFLK
ncbi:MAG: saccharopine dehydrogenase C-terminal domain-containing protein [Bacteroidota bacterium]